MVLKPLKLSDQTSEKPPINTAFTLSHHFYLFFPPFLSSLPPFFPTLSLSIFLLSLPSTPSIHPSIHSFSPYTHCLFFLSHSFYLILFVSFPIFLFLFVHPVIRLLSHPPPSFSSLFLLSIFFLPYLSTLYFLSLLSSHPASFFLPRTIHSSAYLPFLPPSPPVTEALPNITFPSPSLSTIILFLLHHLYILSCLPLACPYFPIPSPHTYLPICLAVSPLSLFLSYSYQDYTSFLPIFSSQTYIPLLLTYLLLLLLFLLQQLYFFSVSHLTPSLSPPPPHHVRRLTEEDSRFT